MEVIIDGVRYVPELPVCDKPHVLETKFMSSDLNREVTIREYLHALLQALWAEGEGLAANDHLATAVGNTTFTGRL